MKKLLTSYTFSPGTRKITITADAPTKLEQFLLITNVDTNVVVYSFADPTKGGSYSNGVLTLDYDTSSMSSTASLQIFADLPTSPETELLTLLSRLVRICEPISIQDTSNRQRVTVDVMPTTAVSGSLTSAGTVSTVTSLSQIAGVDSRWQIIDWSRQAYNSGIRNNLINS